MFSRTTLGCALLLSLSAVGCDDYYKSDTGVETNIDTGVSTAPPTPSIRELGWGCDESAYWFDVRADGLAGGGWLYIYQTGSATPWNEDHPVAIYSAAADGSTTHLYLDLPSVYPDYTAVISGSTTLFDCSAGAQMQDTLTFVMAIDDTRGNLQVDCGVWGHSPDGVPASQAHCPLIEPSAAPRL